MYMNLKEIREEKKLRQNVVAAKIGVTPQAVSNYEKGIREPNLMTLRKLAETYEVTVDELVKAITDDENDHIG